MSSPNNAYKTYRNLSTTGATSAETGILPAAIGMHRGGGVQLLGTFTATVQFEETLDGGTTWIAKTVYPVGGGAGVTSATGTGQWKFSTGGSTHFRVRCSAFTSGPVAVVLVLTEGVDPIAEPKKTLDGASGAAVSYGFTPLGITTKTTTLVKAGAGVIGDITINKSGSTDTITVYDALTATGTPLATITSPTVGMKFCELYRFSVGLTIVTGGTTAGDYTVSYQ
jgi:hypothetical protein